MFDGNWRQSVDRGTKPIGTLFVRVGITADILTLIGMLVSVACSVVIATGHLWWGFWLLIAAALPDLLDGPVAKQAGTQSIRGAFFDSVADRVTDSVVLGGIAWFLAVHRHATGATLILPFALLGASQLISYERAKAEIFGFDAKGGLMERAERIVALCIGLVFNHFLVPVLWIMLVLTTLTGVQRFVKVWRQATDANPMLSSRRRETPPLVRNFFQAWTDADERRRRRWREWSEEQRQVRRQTRQTRSGRRP